MHQLDVLVVCLGNVCRSPLAERVLRQRFDQLLGREGRTVRVSSAGAVALVGRQMDADAAAALRALGGDPEGFVSRQWRGELADGADLVLAATREQRSRVLEDAPRALKRTFTIREFAALARAVAEEPPAPKSPAELVRRAAAWRSAAGIEDYDVPDPFGCSLEVHEQVAGLLERECTTIAEALSAALLRSEPRPLAQS
ncbi:MAG TPA: hypothetical protein VER39_09855 [Nocardioidaceae bacterium]|nr:hypothetical protein [Nocardioidaceae bacterium]